MADAIITKIPRGDNSSCVIFINIDDVKSIFKRFFFSTHKYVKFGYKFDPNVVVVSFSARSIRLFEKFIITT